MAPMTRGFSPDGMPGDDVAAYYARRASSLGLLITEGTYIDASAGSSDRVPRFFGARSLAGWQRVAAAVHAAGGAIFPQLWHLGAQRRPGSPPFPDAPVISPSGLNPAGIAVAEPASVAALEDVTGRVRPRRRRGADGRVRRHRVRPHRRRPRCAGRPRVGGQARRRPPVGNPPLRQVRRRGPALTAVRPPEIRSTTSPRPRSRADGGPSCRGSSCRGSSCCGSAQAETRHAGSTPPSVTRAVRHTPQVRAGRGSSRPGFHRYTRRGSAATPKTCHFPDA